MESVIKYRKTVLNLGSLQQIVLRIDKIADSDFWDLVKILFLKNVSKCRKLELANHFCVGFVCHLLSK